MHTIAHPPQHCVYYSISHDRIPPRYLIAITDLRLTYIVLTIHIQYLSYQPIVSMQRVSLWTTEGSFVSVCDASTQDALPDRIPLCWSPSTCSRVEKGVDPWGWPLEGPELRLVGFSTGIQLVSLLFGRIEIDARSRERDSSKWCENWDDGNNNGCLVLSFVQLVDIGCWRCRIINNKIEKKRKEEAIVYKVQSGDHVIRVQHCGAFMSWIS